MKLTKQDLVQLIMEALDPTDPATAAFLQRGTSPTHPGQVWLPEEEQYLPNPAQISQARVPDARAAIALGAEQAQYERERQMSDPRFREGFAPVDYPEALRTTPEEWTRAGGAEWTPAGYDYQPGLGLELKETIRQAVDNALDEASPEPYPSPWDWLADKPHPDSIIGQERAWLEQNPGFKIDLKKPKKK